MKTTSSRKGSNLISRAAILYYLKCLDTNKKLRHRQKHKRRAVNRIFFEEVQTLSFLNKDFISVIINMFKELKETTSEELKENMITKSYQIENIIKQIKFKTLKKELHINSRVENYNN